MAAYTLTVTPIAYTVQMNSSFLRYRSLKRFKQIMRRRALRKVKKYVANKQIQNRTF